jgi:TRAP-type C4-dicarboxylate transport system substrate-binding protein
VWNKLSDADKKVFTEMPPRAPRWRSARRSTTTRPTASPSCKKDGMQVVEKVDGESFRKAVAPAYANFAKEFGADKIAAIQAVK